MLLVESNYHKQQGVYECLHFHTFYLVTKTKTISYVNTASHLLDSAISCCAIDELSRSDTLLRLDYPL